MVGESSGNMEGTVLGRGRGWNKSRERREQENLAKGKRKTDSETYLRI